MTTGVLKVVKSTLEEKEVHWKIPNFFSLNQSSLFDSPILAFMDAIWYLQIDPSQGTSNDHIALRLNIKDVGTNLYNVRCTFGIVKGDSSLIRCSSCDNMFSEGKSRLIAWEFFTRSALLKQKSELMPWNELTIMCNLKKPDAPTKLIGLDTLSDHFKNLLANKNSCDVTLQVKDKEFRAHKVILIARSPVFAAMFEHDLREKQTGIINIPDCDPESFQDFLEYLYCGKLENISLRNAIHLYKNAEKYNIDELKLFCKTYMGQNLKVENIFDVFILAEVYDEKDLHAAALDFFSRNLREIFEISEWKTLLKNNCDLANKILIEMTSKVEVVEKTARWVAA